MNDILTKCFQASGADIATAERAAFAATEPDIISVMIAHQANSIMRVGNRTLDQARDEATDAVMVFLADVARQSPKDVGIGKALRQAHAWRLMNAKLTYSMIADRLGIHIVTAQTDCSDQTKRRHDALVMLRTA